jgi:hypothetical protein
MKFKVLFVLCCLGWLAVLGAIWYAAYREYRRLN